MLDLDNLLDTIEQTENKRKDKESHKADENFLNCKEGFTYLVRLLPYTPSPADTFVDYEEYGFQSCIPGQGYIYLGRTPKSVGKEDPVARLQWATYQEGKADKDDGKMNRSYRLLPQKKRMVNVYVIDDPSNPENNGTVKVLRFSSRLNKEGTPTGHIHKIIESGIFGDNKDEVGKRAFDLTKSGCNLKIKVTKNAGGWNDYSESSFTFPKDLGLTKARIEEIYAEAKDLTSLLPEVKSDAEIQSILDTHWFGNKPSVDSEVNLNDDDDDQIDLSPKKSSVSEIEEDMDDFLDGLDISNDD